MLDPASASDQLRNYESNLGKELNIGQCILRFLFPDEGRLAMVLRWLNSQASLHVWEIAHRIPPPEFFYKAHLEILEACKLCGAVIFDAATPSTWARTLPALLQLALVSLSSRIKPLLEMRLAALEHLFFNVFDVGEPVPYAHSHFPANKLEGQLVCEPYFDLEPGLRSIRHSVSFLLVNSKAGPRSGRSDKEGAGIRPRAAVAWAAGTIASSATYLPVSYHLRAVQARVPARR